ncbi:MAG: outer membrane protein assembly factor BamD [Thermoanaerobaculia bacterium]
MRHAVVIAALGLVALAGCRSAPTEDPILRLSAEESLAQGKELLAREKYARARPYFEHAFEAEPNSVTGRTALLLVADTYYLEGNSSSYEQAEAKYRDFLNRFPTSDQATYVQFQIANSLAKRMEKPDRDQTVTRKALEAYRDLIRLYPTSAYAAQAKQQIEVVRANLAEHEFVVGRFYLRYGRPVGAVERFRFLLDQYPEYPEKDKVLYHLGLAYLDSDQPDAARETFARLRAEHPDSPYNGRVPDAEKASR